ncbi:hypothetical protein ACWGN5_26990 [Streptomyces sp. NPDC055815]
MPANLPDTPAAPTAPATGSWIGPLFSTLLTLPLGFFTLLVAMLSPMGCDSCGEAEAHRFDAAFDVAYPTFLVGLLVSLGLLIAAWVPPRRAGFVVAAPLTVVLNLLVFLGLLGT